MLMLGTTLRRLPVASHTRIRQWLGGMEAHAEQADDGLQRQTRKLFQLPDFQTPRRPTPEGSFGTAIQSVAAAAAALVVSAYTVAI